MTKITGVEIDFVVTDSRKALELYKSIFEVQTIEVTDFEKGQNEAVFSIYDVRFHMLDENPEFQLFAPKEDSVSAMWFNVMVPDIEETFKKAEKAGCTVIQPVTQMPDFGAANAMFKDTFGYVWMLHEIFKEVSFEDRVKAVENMKEDRK